MVRTSSPMDDGAVAGGTQGVDGDAGPAELRAKAREVLFRAAAEVVAAAGVDTLAEIVSAASDPAHLLRIAARDLPPGPSGVVMAMLADARRTAAFKRDLLDRAGGALTTSQVRDLLGFDSTRSVRRATATGRLLAVDDRRRKLFPAFQFDGSAVLPGLADVLAAAPGTSPWAMLQFLVEGDEGLGGGSPIELLKDGVGSVKRVVRFAATLAG